MSDVIEKTGVEPAGPDLSEAAHPAIAVKNLTKRYGKFTAVEDLVLDIPQGSIYGLVGPNGAGKTTTFAVAATLLRPTSGSVEVMGHDPARDARAVRRVMGYMPDGLGVYADLDVDEYLRFFAAAYKLPSSRWDQLIDDLLELVALHSKRTARVDSLSRGMKQRLSLARALVHDPEVLILDEPASGLDPRARSELRSLLLQLASMGKTIVISSHILAELEDVCTHIAIMQEGKVLAAGSTSDVTSQLAAGRRLRARFADGTTEDFEVADETGQAELLRRLALDSERQVIEFTRVGGGLEELFLSLTKGTDE
ncbi:MAG: ABC transporter ATP-binding protein [Ilumatobacter sp.]|uniref:ABC transporter ATP-binding protein n=1 Tax=Ilumatobacter sp. TaxID=1967498 RepID=UPI003C754CBA